MIIFCVVCYVLIGYVVAIAAYVSERDRVAMPYVDVTFVWLSGIFWPLVILSASVIHFGEKLHSKSGK